MLDVVIDTTYTDKQGEQVEKREVVTVQDTNLHSAMEQAENMLKSMYWEKLGIQIEIVHTSFVNLGGSKNDG